MLGWVIDATSFQTSWAIVAAMLLLAAAIVTMVRTLTQQPLPARAREDP